jgi:CRP/FNR family cyclic AMP-dependent transcriptional regulator
MWRIEILSAPPNSESPDASMGRIQNARAEQSLERIAIFKGLRPAALAKIQRCCCWRSFQPGESILGYLDVSDNVYFVIAGAAHVRIYSAAGKSVTFRDLGPGDMFGEYAAIDHRHRSASVEAHTSCLVASLSADAFREVVKSNSAVLQALLEHFVSEIRELTTRVYEFSTLAVCNRIHAEVLRLAKLAPRVGKTARIVPAPTHVEIASRISSHREAVTREVNRLARLGIIERQRGGLLVTDVDRLTQMVHEATGE